MTNKLISLVLLVLFLTTGYSYSEDQFLFPKKKPSVFKEVQRNIDTENWKNLPQKKPIIGIKKEKIVKDVQVSKEKIEEKKQTVLKKEVKILTSFFKTVCFFSSIFSLLTCTSLTIFSFFIPIIGFF